MNHPEFHTELHIDLAEPGSERTVVTLVGEEGPHTNIQKVAERMREAGLEVVIIGTNSRGTGGASMIQIIGRETFRQVAAGTNDMGRTIIQNYAGRIPAKPRHATLPSLRDRWGRIK